MTSDLNSLTARLLSGQMTCGAYADAVYAAQFGARVSSGPPSEDDDSEECTEECADCERDFNYLEEGCYCACCGEPTCENCLVVSEDPTEDAPLACAGCAKSRGDSDDS